MDPDTGQFHRLKNDLEKKLVEEKGWAVFRIGEIISGAEGDVWRGKSKDVRAEVR